MNRIFTRRVQAMLVVLLLAASVGAEAQWKWRDANGRVQYSDLPPPANTPPQNILQSPIRAPMPRVTAIDPPASAASGVPASAASAVDPALEAKRKQAEQEEAAKQRAQEAQQALAKAQNCERAQTALRTLDSGQRISRVNPQGEREYLDDAARAREQDQARKSIAANCR
jgi:Domain of unknown function (DUF4124)